jgi:hypothetical protein
MKNVQIISKNLKIQIDSFGRCLRYTNQYQQQRCATARIYFSLDPALYIDVGRRINLIVIHAQVSPLSGSNV